MLDKIDLTKRVGKKMFKEQIEPLRAELGKLQRDCKELKLPVIIAFEGFDGAGKGVQIGELIQALDPRGFEVHAVNKETKEERMYPFLRRFWVNTPENGRIAIFDSSWYRRVLIDRFDQKMSEKELLDAFQSISSFERQLTDGGTLIIKLFLCIDQKEQEKRFEKLLKKEETAWRVREGDLKRNKEFAAYRGINEDMLKRTDFTFAPWTLIEATDKRYATLKIYRTVIESVRETIERIKSPQEEAPALCDSDLDEGKRGNILDNVNLSLSISESEYRERLDELQHKMKKLHNEVYRKRIPVVLVFEGWDAAGKGGVIKRLVEKMDPRGYLVQSTPAPNPVEKAHHYLWRFWKAIPRAGHVTLFDRSWYGRILVERIEGFCSSREWQRAYQEINDMESDLVNAGAVVVKFWIHIDKDEQERRFHARMNNPQKQWKITEEDWRNREKWNQYETAVNEMLLKTSTPKAPWIVVEGNCKFYARIKVLENVVEAIEDRLKDKK